jgi:hypothetical protein
VRGGQFGLRAGVRFLGLGYSGALRGIFLKTVDNAGQTTTLQLVLYTGSADTVVATTAVAILTINTLYKYDIQLINYGVSGTINVYQNGILILTYTGDIRITGISSFNCIQAQSGVDSNGWDYQTTQPRLSEVIVASVDTRSLSVTTHLLNAAGSANQWTGAYTDIDEVAINDTDFIYTDTADYDAQFGLSNLPAGVFYPLAIKISARAMKSVDAAIGTLKLGVLSASTVDVDAGSALTNSFATYSRIAETINGSALTSALVDALEINLRSAA